MRDIAAIEVNVLVSELRDRIVSSHFKNFYEIEKDSFLLALSKDGREIDVYIKLNKTINETGFKERVDKPTQFALAVRKRLESGRVRSIEQHGLDRIVVVVFEGREEKKLVLEMFGKGNLLILGRDDIAEVVYKSVSYRERELRRNMVYTFPKSEALDRDTIESDGIGEAMGAIKDSGEKLISAMAKRISTGPLYLEDIISRVDLDANAKACDQEIGKSGIAKATQDFFEREKNPEPRIYLSGSRYIDFAILPISKYEKAANTETVRFETLNELLDHLYLMERSIGLDEEKAREIEELSASIEKLKEQTEEMREKRKRCTEIANSVFGHMNEINALIDHIRKSKVRSAEELDKSFTSSKMKVKKIDAKNKTVKIEVTD